MQTCKEIVPRLYSFSEYIVFRLFSIGYLSVLPIVNMEFIMNLLVFFPSIYHSALQALSGTIDSQNTMSITFWSILFPMTRLAENNTIFISTVA